MSARHCTVIRANGRPCRATPQTDADICVFHDPGRAAEVADGRRLGGLRRRRERTLAAAFEFGGLGDAESIRRLLEIAAFDCLSLEASIPRVRALIATAGAATKLLEIQDLAERVATLEVAYRAAGLLPGGPPTAEASDPLRGLE